MSTWPLTAVCVRMLWLRALCGVAESTAVLTAAPATTDASGLCIAAVLCDTQKRLCVLGGRDGLSRSLGSVFGCFVTRFLAGFGGRESHSIRMPGILSWCSSVAISRDGATLLVSEGGHRKSTAVYLFSVAKGICLRTIGGWGDGPLQFKQPRQVCISRDDFGFVADFDNHRIQVLTPQFEFHGFVGVGRIRCPAGVCADSDVVAVVSELLADRVSVFARSDGSLLRRFGTYGESDGQLRWPSGLCFMGSIRHIAVADDGNNRISVFTLDGEFVRTICDRELKICSDVMPSDSGDELVVTGRGRGFGSSNVAIFSASGEFLKTVGANDFAGVAVDFTGVAVYGHTIYALDPRYQRCVVFT